MGTESEGFTPESAYRDLLAESVVQTLWHNEWVSLKVVRKLDAGVSGYVFSHETRCAGRIVAVLPYRDSPAGRRYLVKSEMTPCWGFDQVRSAITGGYEGGDIEDDAVREMLEETGYAITRDELIPLGESFASKSSDTRYSLFSADLTGREAGEATGDGTRLESESEAVWVTAAELALLEDPQLAVMHARLSALEPADSAPGTITVDATFLRCTLRDAIRACERDVANDDPDAADFLAEYRAALAGIPADGEATT